MYIILRVLCRGDSSEPVGRGLFASDVVPQRLEPGQQTGPEPHGFRRRVRTAGGQRVEQHLGPVRRDQRVLEPGQVGLHAGQLVLELVVCVQVQPGLPGLLVHGDQILAVTNVRHQVLLRKRARMRGH